MSLTEQIKTAQGLIPTCGAALSHCENANEEALSFEVADLRGATSRQEPSCSPQKEPCLEDLAFANDGTLLSVAKRIGPLFGVSLEEPVADWRAAISVARKAVQIQEVVNGSKPVRILGLRSDTAAPGIAKIHACIDGSKAECDAYALSTSFQLSDESAYARLLPPFPYIERFGGSCFDYAVVFVASGCSLQHLTVMLLSFRAEPSAREFAEMLKACCGFDVNPADIQRLFRRFDGDVLAGAFSVSISETPLDAGDLGKLGRMVQTIVSLHLSRVRVDVVRSQDRDDFLLFESALSYLWYRFAKNPGHAKIGYCQQCGKAFSLAGHRGIVRRYCSEECRTRAKNQRTKEARDRARALFLSGASIEDIAREVYPQLGSRFRESRVRSDLRTWPALKEQAKQARGEGNGAFLERLEQAGIGMDGVSRGLR